MTKTIEELRSEFADVNLTEQFAKEVHAEMSAKSLRVTTEKNLSELGRHIKARREAEYRKISALRAELVLCDAELAELDELEKSIEPARQLLARASA